MPLTTNAPFFFQPTPFFFSPPNFFLIFILYYLMNSAFLRMLAVPSETDFCKAPTLFDIPNFSKLHSKLFGMDPSAPIIIGTINVCLPHILAISNRRIVIHFFVSFQNRVIIDGTRNIIIKHFFVFFFTTTISVLRCSICLST